jgi:hypothetical protein
MRSGTNVHSVIGGINMDRRLSNDELGWLYKLREAKVGMPTPTVPVDVAVKLKLLGYAVPNERGEYGITMRGRDELIDRDRVSRILN